MAAFPPPGPVTVTKTIPSYLYVQYNDDDDLQAFVVGYNGMAQDYVDWFNQAGVPIYTGLTGSLLDWVGVGLYGYARPTIESFAVSAKGPVNTFLLNTIEVDQYIPGTAATFFLASDDVYQRCLTWHFYKGDGKVFSLLWLKRRVLRWLYGTNGTDVNVADTSGVSITISGHTVTIDLSRITNVTTDLLMTFEYAIASSILELPPQYVFTVTL